MDSYISYTTDIITCDYNVEYAMFLFVYFYLVQQHFSYMDIVEVDLDLS